MCFHSMIAKCDGNPKVLEVISLLFNYAGKEIFDKIKIVENKKISSTENENISSDYINGLISEKISEYSLKNKHSNVQTQKTMQDNKEYHYSMSYKNFLSLSY